jgi:cysteine desulfurase
MSAVYLDYGSTALTRPEVIEAVSATLTEGGNPSAVHAMGRRARLRVENARAAVAALVGAAPTQVVFSSGGTESTAQAVASAIAAGCERLIVSATEHPCVAETAAASGTALEILGVDGRGVVDLAELQAMLARPGRAMVAVHLANNESGVIQPLAEIRGLTEAAGAWLHVDAVQAAGKMPIDMDALGCHTLTLSAHKLGGPQGVGALIARDGAEVIRVLHGAGQERGLRAGTENVSGIVGFGVAAECSARDLDAAVAHAAWRDEAEARVKAVGAFVVGEGAPRLPNTLFMAVADWPSPQQLITMDLQELMISAGSACSSGKAKPSKAMTAMGLHDLALGAIRVTGGWGTSREDWIRFADAWTAAYAARRQRAA